MSRRTKFMLPLSLCLASFAFAQEEAKQEEPKKEGQSAETTQANRDAKALEIVKATDTAIKKVKFVKYHSIRESTGVAVRFAPPSEGEVISAAGESAGSSKSRIHVKTKVGDSEEVIEFTVGRDGEEYYLIDPAAKKAYVDIDPAVAGNRGRLALGLTMQEFFHEKPFDDELGADTVELKGTEKVGDQDCDVVRVVYKGGQGESIWCFSKRDHLPRRRTMVFDNPAFGKGSSTITLTDLVIEAPSDSDPFKLTIPEGFEKVEDFAPDIDMPRPQ